MAIATEHLYENCTCDSGMRGGLRCGDCGGRGIVSKGTKPTGAVIVEPNQADGVTDDDLDNVDINHARQRAKDLGLSAGGSKAAIVARIRDFNTAAGIEADAEADAAHTATDDGETEDDASDETET